MPREGGSDLARESLAGRAVPLDALLVEAAGPVRWLLPGTSTGRWAFELARRPRTNGRRLAGLAAEAARIGTGVSTPTRVLAGSQQSAHVLPWAPRPVPLGDRSPISTMASTTSNGTSKATASEAPPRCYVYTYPSRKAVRAVMAKVKRQRRVTGTDQPLHVLLIRLNRRLRGWRAYFRRGVSSAASQHLSSYAWGRVIGWLRRKHRLSAWKDLRRRYCDGRSWPASDERALFKPGHGTHHALPLPLPLPGHGDPFPLAHGGMRDMSQPRQTGLLERPVP